MTTVALPKTSSFFDGADESADTFRGTIIISREAEGKFGTQWFQCIFNHDSGKYETNYVKNADKSNLKGYRKSTKKRVLDAFAANGVNTKVSSAEAFVGLTMPFTLDEHDNGPQYPATLTFIPCGPAEEPMSKAWCAEQAAKYEAAVASRSGGRPAATRTAPAAVTSYTEDQLEGAAALLDGVNEDDLDLVIDKVQDDAVRAGLFNGTLIAAVIGAGLIEQDDSGTYRAS